MRDEIERLAGKVADAQAALDEARAELREAVAKAAEAEGAATMEIAKRAGVSQMTAWRWWQQEKGQ